MIADLKPYPAMKDSGVPWLGAVPEHWDVGRLKRAFRRIVCGTTPSSAEASYWDGDITWVTPADVSRAERLRDSLRRITNAGLRSCSSEVVPAGSIVVTSRAPVGNGALAETELCTNQGCKALIIDDAVVEGDPVFDTRRAKKKLRRYVESHDHAIRLKAEIMVDHFHEQVLALSKIGGEARAMVVTSGIERAIQYYHAIRDYLAERKSRHQAIVAFSGEHEYGGAKVSEASLNGFPSSQIADQIQQDPYRFLICADKFQTGYDEPLLHTMYVDKVLSGIKAVQTLSRLNRAHPKKHDVFVLDFMNDADTIQEAFADYYRTTVLAEETDPNKLHDLKAALAGYQVYPAAQVDELVALYLGGADRDRLDPILDACVAEYRERLDEDAQVDFKGKAKAFLRAYGFLSSILPYTNAEWEKLSIFLTFLVPKLPAPVEEDLSKGILEAIDMDSYRVEKQAAVKILLPAADAEIEPVPTTGGGHKPEPELDRLSNILKAFNDQFGNIPWADADRVHKLITEDIPQRVAADTAYQNARQNSDKQNARIEHDRALARVMTAVLKDDTELFKQFMDNESFRRWMTDTVFGLTYGALGREA
jgi:type I restriction enzyme R subunit